MSVLTGLVEPICRGIGSRMLEQKVFEALNGKGDTGAFERDVTLPSGQTLAKRVKGQRSTPDRESARNRASAPDQGPSPCRTQFAKDITLDQNEIEAALMACFGKSLGKPSSQGKLPK